MAKERGKIMLKYKMIENSDGFITYQYFPEGNEDSGFLTINKNDGTVVKQELAKTDEFKRYFFHMLDRIEDFIANKNFLDEGIVAWG